MTTISNQRGRAWRRPARSTREKKLKDQRARQQRYEQRLGERREPTTPVIACALLDAFLEVTSEPGGTIPELTDALMRRLHPHYDVVAVKDRLKRIRPRRVHQDD